MCYENFIISGVTILGGVLVFVAGQLINELIIKPVICLKQRIGGIASSLIYYADIYANPNPESRREQRMIASNELRKQASELLGISYAIGIKTLKSFRLPSKQNIKKASEGLIFLSNSLFRGDGVKNDDKRREIENLLRIYY
jgi:hypothetical protein